MDEKPGLALRRLEGDDVALANALAMSINPDDPGESWGIGPDGPTPGARQIWGVLMEEALICALWLKVVHGGEVRLVAMAVPRKRGRMGLLPFIVDELGPRLAKAGGIVMAVTIERGGTVLGDSLDDAGFVGPDRKEDGYPAGEWRRELLYLPEQLPD